MLRLAVIILKNILIFPWAFWKLCKYAKHTDEYPELEKYAHIQYMMRRAVKAANVDIEITGTEHFPKENGFLMCGNHQGMFDVVPLVAVYPGPLSTVFKHELSDIPLLKQIIACLKCFAMDRDNPRQSMGVINAVTAEIKAGRNYMIFPEGTRNRDKNRMGEFHSGTFRCALKAKCPIFPVVFIDSYKVLDAKGLGRVSMKMKFLEVIPYEEFAHMKTNEVADMVRDRIAKVIYEETGELPKEAVVPAE